MSARHGRPNATGRSSGKLSGREKKLWGPPQGKPWTWHSAEMLRSDAWRALSRRGRLLLDFLELEHMAHAGRANGNLKATYDQLAKFGIVRRHISQTIDEVEQLGFIDVERGGRWNMTNRPSLFRLTYYTDQLGNPATNDWRRYRKPPAEKRNRPTENDTTVVPPCDTTERHTPSDKPQSRPEILTHEKEPIVPPCVTASISPGDTPVHCGSRKKRRVNKRGRVQAGTCASDDDKTALLEIPKFLDRRGVRPI